MELIHGLFTTEFVDVHWGLNKPYFYWIESMGVQTIDSE